MLSKVAEVCSGRDLIIGPVCEDNHRQLGAQALAYNLTVVANSPIDINLAKQLNILLNNLGVPLDKIIIDPTTGGLGYGIEYTYSVMERIRQAALTQDDEKLQSPFLSNLADEVWKCKEAKLPTDAKMGDAAKRGILMEAITATTLLNAGAELLVMRHPEAIRKVREYIAELGGFALPAAARAKTIPFKRAAGVARLSGNRWIFSMRIKIVKRMQGTVMTTSKKLRITPSCLFRTRCLRRSRASDNGPDIAYYLGYNPKEAARIAALKSPILQAKEIGKIEAKIASEPVLRKTTSAPPPIAPISGRGSGSPSYDTTDPRAIKNMSTSEWIEADRQRQMKKLEAQRNR